MADVKFNQRPRALVRPDEVNLEAGWDFRDNELAIWGYPINRSTAGATYNINTRAGTPLVGQGGGLYVVDAAGSYWSRAAQIGVDEKASAYSIEAEFEANPTAARYCLVNGSVGGYETRVEATGEIAISFDRATLSTTAAGFAPGKGPMRVTGIYDPATGSQSLMINGVVYDTDAVVPVAPNGFFALGAHGTIRAGRVYNAVRSVAVEREAYIRDFASKVLWQWTPRDVGEGPAGGILTGSYSGVGGYTCPLGAATMGFVWRPDLSIPAGGRLCLTDTQVAAMNRIDFEFGNRPLFGTWIIEYQIRDPATDSPIIGFTPRRGVDPQAAGSTSYWCWIRTAAGPWWRVSMGYENNTAVPIDSADAPWPGPNAGDRCIAVVSRDVDGSVQTWNYVPNPQRGWWWTTAVGNHVTTLAEGCITVAPRGSYIERISWLQGAATPHELGIQVP